MYVLIKSIKHTSQTIIFKYGTYNNNVVFNSLILSIISIC